MNDRYVRCPECGERARLLDRDAGWWGCTNRECRHQFENRLALILGGRRR